MQDHPLSCWVYIVAALLLSTSLFFSGAEGRDDILRSALTKLTVYFYSFAPAGMLVYSLYKLSLLQ